MYPVAKAITVTTGTGSPTKMIQRQGRNGRMKPINIVADKTQERGMATCGFDDDGVATSQWDLVADGTLVGYQTDRVFARRLGLERSAGCAYADSPHHVPIQRMANVSLQPDPSTDTTTA